MTAPLELRITAVLPSGERVLPPVPIPETREHEGSRRQQSDEVQLFRAMGPLPAPGHGLEAEYVRRCALIKSAAWEATYE